MIAEFQGQYRWLSNFWMCSVDYNGFTYKSVEHAYQAAKATNVIEHDWVAEAPTPGEAKRRGKQVKMVGNFDDIKDTIMYELVLAKFSQNRGLNEKLLNTGSEELVEGNYWNDTYWGVCRGKGQNKLGKILMAVRSELSGSAED